MIAACMWDMRAHVEQQLRMLTESQRLIDTYRANLPQQNHSKHRLQANARLMRESHDAVSANVSEVVRLIDALPVA